MVSCARRYAESQDVVSQPNLQGSLTMNKFALFIATAGLSAAIGASAEMPFSVTVPNFGQGGFDISAGALFSQPSVTDLDYETDFSILHNSSNTVDADVSTLKP